MAAVSLDKIGRKITVPAFYALAAMGVLLLATATRTGDWRWVLAAFTLANLFATGSWISAYPTFFGNISYPPAFNGNRFVGRSWTHRGFPFPDCLNRSG
jgi:hypothetical protein